MMVGTDTVCVWPDLERSKEEVEGVSICWLLYSCETKDEVIIREKRKGENGGWKRVVKVWEISKGERQREWKDCL